MTTTEPPLDNTRARLANNARGHRPDEGMEKLLALRESDPARYAALPGHVLSQVEVYADLKANYRRAVAAGAITEEIT